MALRIPEEHLATFHWMVSKILRKEWETLATSVPDSMERVMKAPLISAVIKVVGKERVKEFLEARLIWLNAQMNVAHPMNPSQINFAADTLLERYPHESIADFVLCFRRGAQGYYGSTFHQMDASVIMGWMAELLEEKAMYVERDITTSKQQEKETDVDYEAFKERLEAKRRQYREERVEEIGRQADESEIRRKYVPLTGAKLKERTLHDKYLGAKWKHDQDPRNRDEKGLKLLVQFMSEAQWREEQKVVEVLNQKSKRKNK